MNREWTWDASYDGVTVIGVALDNPKVRWLIDHPTGNVEGYARVRPWTKGGPMRKWSATFENTDKAIAAIEAGKLDHPAEPPQPVVTSGLRGSLFV